MTRSLLDYLSVVAGALITGVFLELFYIPYGFLDGGMTGLAAVVGRTAGIPPVLVLLLTNIACLAVGVHHLGPEFMRKAAAGLLSVVAILWLIDPVPALLEPGASAVVGGTGLGIGLGLVLRSGGALDGCEILGLVCRHKFRLPILRWLFGFNLGVFALVLALFGLSESFHSILAQAQVQVVLLLLLRRT